tara:strand:+ start:170 stop:355 length:186 start_codon:yes stop_codon:yes gene_type:complete
MSQLSLKETNLSNKRELQETYQEYRNRLKENYYRIKYYLRGEVVWNSIEKGPLIRDKKLKQ